MAFYGALQNRWLLILSEENKATGNPTQSLLNIAQYVQTQNHDLETECVLMKTIDNHHLNTEHHPAEQGVDFLLKTQRVSVFTRCPDSELHPKGKEFDNFDITPYVCTKESMFNSVETAI